MRELLAGIALVVSLGAGAAGDPGVVPSPPLGGAQRLAARFASRGLAYPPRGVALVALKREARLELWAEAGSGWSFVRSYLIRAASGRLGPKLREGDHQVPEGVYRIAALNPASRFHLALRLDYPNAFDRARAAEDGRAWLGGDIMIHGGAASDGCLPVGDAAVEELYALADRVGIENVLVIVSPVDLRRVDVARAAARAAERPRWLRELYATIARALEPFALPADEPAAAVRRARMARTSCRPYDQVDCTRRCGAGNAASCARSGLLYARQRGVDPARAWSLLRRSCTGGDALGCAGLAHLYLTDDGPRRDAARAAELAGTACQGGDGHGCSDLAELCTDRIIYPETPDGCGSGRVRRLRQSAVARLATDCRGWGAYDCATLAALYYPDDARLARRFAAGACRNGDPGGCYVLGRLGEDTGDAAGAAALYAQACERGYSPACERIADVVPTAVRDTR